MQRHVAPRRCNSGYLASGDGGAAAGAPPITNRSLLARDKDPMDYDMTEDLHAALMISPRTNPATVTSLVPPMDDMPRRDKDPMDQNMLLDQALPTQLHICAPALHHHPPALNDMPVDHKTTLPANSATTTQPQGRLRGQKKNKSTVQFNHRGDNAHFVKWNHRVGTNASASTKQSSANLDPAT